MSGVLGFAATPGEQVDVEHFKRWAPVLSEIGPDRFGTWTEPRAGLAHALRVVYAGDADCTYPRSIDRRVWIAADARIDDRNGLRNALRAAGQSPPEDASDADLILYAYAAWGIDCPSHLIGDFAFALWDSTLGRMLAATDPFGVRQMFYSLIGGGVIVSNWAPALYSHPAVDRSPDDRAIVGFLVANEMGPDSTAFVGIKPLGAAHSLVWENGRHEVRRYWRMPIEEPLRYPREHDYDDEFLTLLRRAIADRMRGGDAGVLMSGGLDSSTVAAVARQVNPAPGAVRGHTNVFEQLLRDHEREYAQAVAAYTGVPVDFHPIDESPPFARPGEFVDGDPVLVDAPFLARAGPGYEAIAQQTRVALTGHGTDAILGYEPLVDLLRATPISAAVSLFRNVPAHAVRYGRRPPFGLLRSLTPMLRGTRRGNVSVPSWLRPEMQRLIGEPEHHLLQPEHPYRRRAYQLAGGEWLPRAVAPTTAFARGFGISLSHPFLDVRVARFCLRVPPIPYCWDKHLIRSASRTLLPASVRKRPKTVLSGDALKAWLQRYGADALPAAEPGEQTRRYYLENDFMALRHAVVAGSAWIESRPLVLELFWRHWSRWEVRQ